MDKETTQDITHSGQRESPGTPLDQKPQQALLNRLRVILAGPFGVWAAVIGVLLAIVGAFCHILDLSPKACGTFEAGALVLSGLLFLLQRYLPRLVAVFAKVPKQVLWVCLIGMSAATLLVLHYRPYDPWLAWRHELFAQIYQCKGSEECVAQSISQVRHPPGESNWPGAMSDMAADLRAGTVLMQNDVVRNKLWAWYGVDEKFVGSGFSQPSLTTDYSVMRVAEVLVPNYEDDHDGVLIWKLQPIATSLEKTIADVIYNETPAPPKIGQRRQEVSAYRTEIQRRLAAHDALLPPVVRFAQLTDREYSGCLGRTDRLRVFASQLEPVINMKLEDAARYSGYVVKPDNKNEKNLFVMVFVPVAAEDVVPGTWAVILSQTKNWSGASKTCTP
jgi:hypothetical protein